MTHTFKKKDERKPEKFVTRDKFICIIYIRNYYPFTFCPPGEGNELFDCRQVPFGIVIADVGVVGVVVLLLSSIVGRQS